MSLGPLGLSEAELSEMRSRCAAATPGPWAAFVTDDRMFQTALYVRAGHVEGDVPVGGVRQHRGRGMSETGGETENAKSVVAITCLQAPRLCDAELGYENSRFIAHAREDVPALLGALDAAMARLNRRGEAMATLVRAGDRALQVLNERASPELDLGVDVVRDLRSALEAARQTLQA